MAQMLQVKRLLKKARLFEIQKITKRMKVLERKKGTELQLSKNQRKVKRLLSELELIKELNLNDASKEVFQEMVKGTLAVNSKTPDDLETRAKWRLLSSRHLQPGLTRLKLKTVKYYRPPSPSDPSINITTSGPSTEEDEISSLCSSGHSDILGSELSDGEMESKLSDSEDEITICSRKIQFESEQTDALPRKRAADPPVVREGSKSRISTLDSVFVGSLSAEKHSGERNSKHKEKRKQKMKNRLGQRARQREWEKQFGTKAKHLLQQRQQQGKQSHKHGQQRHSLGKQSQRHRQQWQLHGKQEEKHSVSGRHTISTKHKERPSSVLKTQNEVLHPSWAASRKKREQEKVIKEFQGQRTVFSDSD